MYMPLREHNSWTTSARVSMLRLSATEYTISYFIRTMTCRFARRRSRVFLGRGRIIQEHSTAQAAHTGVQTGVLNTPKKKCSPHG